jgi:hypothetical protein
MRARFAALLVILRALDWHKVSLTWNFNRWFLLLGAKLYLPSAKATERWDLRCGPDAWDLSSRLYFPLLARDKQLKEATVPDLMVVARHGRFGNNIRQILYSLAVAERLGVREVVARSIPEFPHGSWEVRPNLTLTHDPVLRHRRVARPRTILAGDFFVVPRLPTPIDDVDYTVLGDGLVRASGLCEAPPLPMDTLVIHIRSGDVFRERPHHSLGQPPLSFYEKVLEHSRPQNVVLVYEDTLNPVIPNLQARLESLFIPYSIHSGDLRSDLQLLLSARQLVTGNGTFGQAVLVLSPHIERWYDFGEGKERFPTSRRRSVVSITDREGDYVAALGHWENSPSQRNLMVKYPALNLELTERTS